MRKKNQPGCRCCGKVTLRTYFLDPSCAVAGVALTVKTGAGVTVASGTTDGSGLFVFTPPTGTYYVTSGTKTGYFLPGQSATSTGFSFTGTDLTVDVLMIRLSLTSADDYGTRTLDWTGTTTPLTPVSPPYRWTGCDTPATYPAKTCGACADTAGGAPYWHIATWNSNWVVSTLHPLVFCGGTYYQAAGPSCTSWANATKFTYPAGWTCGPPTDGFASAAVTSPCLPRSFALSPSGNPGISLPNPGTVTLS